MASRLRIALVILAIVVLMVMLRTYGVIGNESPATTIISTVSLVMAFVGLVLAYQSLTIAQDMQGVDKTREKKRTRVRDEDEIPYVVYSLETLYMSMLKTQNELVKSTKDGKIKSEKLCEDAHRRARAHIAAIWQIESKFVNAELSRYYMHLGSVVKHLEELEFTTPDTEINMEKFKEDVDAVLHVMEDMEGASDRNQKIQD